MHVPAISIPVFKGPNGLPVGLQIIGKRNEDRKLFAAARWIHGKLA
jgi:Asp-tRNA(Asn)/Glu-tRNA(Gln) amidotransferase A subunit family amidase